MSHPLDLDQIWSWNALVPESVPGCVHDLIAAIAVHHPDALAVCAWDGDFTYAQLNTLAWQLAHRLISRGIPRQSSIPLLFSKSRWTCVAMLAIIKAGCAAIALDATQPDTRLRSIVQQVQPQIILASPTHAIRASRLADSFILELDDTLLDTHTASLTEELPVVSPSDIVYISFTSGTTGQPKGACISHENVRSAHHHQGKKLGFHSNSRVFDFAPYSFDVAWSNFLHTLCAGGCICIAKEQDMLNDLSAAITEFKATLINVTPTVLRTISPIPPTLQTVLLSGEMPYRDNITRWAGQVRLLNTYGPTECTFKCAFSALSPSLEGRPDIGMGVGFCTWVVDANDTRKLAAPGSEGELFLEGPLVGQGYLSDPEKTSLAFINDPPWLLEGNRNVPGRRGRLYRTGDLVKYLPGGQLIFLGRKDVAQLKIRGQRVEIGDVEHHVRACLDEDLSVIADVVMPRGSDTLSLALFVETKPEFRERVKRKMDDLDRKMREVLPSFMIPTVYLPVDAIPVASTGKADRRRLREMGNGLDWNQIVQLQSTIVSLVEYCEPKTDVERQLRHIWARVLKLEVHRISTADSFLRLGGDSIAAMYLAAEARSIGMSFTVADVFNFPILSDLATKVQSPVQGETAVPFSLLTGSKNTKSICEAAATLCGIETGEIEDIYPCTALQQGMLAISARDRDTDYTSRTAFDMPGDINTIQLGRAWMSTVTETPILRTRIIELPGEGLVQVVVKTPVPLILYEDIRKFVTSSQDSYLGRPLCRAGIIEGIPPRLALEMHHSIFDGWTRMIILDTLEAKYRAFGPIPSPHSFQSFVKYVMTIDSMKATEFWRDQLAGSEATVFPCPQYEPKKKIDFNHTIDGLQWLRTGITPSSVVRSGLSILLASYTNSEDVKYGVTVSGRQAPVPDIERIAGPTIATVPVRVKFNWDLTVDGLLQQVQRQMIETTEYEQFGLQHIQRIDEEIEAASQFQLLLIIQPAHQGESQKPGGLFCQAQTASVFDDFQAGIQERSLHSAYDGREDTMGIYNSYAMMVICQLGNSGLELKINYDSGAIEEDEVQRLARQFEHLLRQMCSEQIAQLKLRDLSLLAKDDLIDIWEWNRDPKSAPTKSVTSMITQQAADQLDKTAICAWDNQLTYRQLQEAWVALAYRLREEGATPGSIVVLSFEKSSWMVVSIIALLQLGSIVLPISASSSSQQASQIVDVLQPKLVVTSTESKSSPFAGLTATVNIHELIKSRVQASGDIYSYHHDVSDPAFILFTSGSTGTPKPIQWSHGTLSTNIVAAIKCFGLDTNSRVFQFAGYDFDVSTVETLSTLAAGGCLCIPFESDRTNRLTESIVHYNANWICLTPSVAQSIAPKDIPSLKTLVFAGEKLQQKTAFQWAEHVDAVYNWYGPAEASVATSYMVDSNTWQPGIIGRSQAGFTWLVDPKNPNILAPVGAVAELCIEGPILATYTGINGATLNEKTLVSPSWLHQGHWKVPGRKSLLYRTGDLVKYKPDGRILFLGRAQDYQRKLRGQRVDLCDIERCVQGFLGERIKIQVVAEIFTPSHNGKDTLALFFSPSDAANEPTLPVDMLEAYLLTILPSYMIPRLYIPIDTIPISRTGKTDRRRLRQIGNSFNAEQLAAMQPSRKEAREPSTEYEKTLQRLWAEVLGVTVDSIFATDNFLRLGGDSITAMRLVALARNDGLTLAVSDVFEAPDLESMSKRIGKGGRYVGEILPFSLLDPGVSKEESRKYAARRFSVEDTRIVDIYPCTALQEGLLALSVKNNGQYISRSVLKIQSNVCPNRLRRAWLSTVQKLHILRTRIIDLPGQGLVQVLLDDVPWRCGTDVSTYIREDEKEPMGLGTELSRAAIVQNNFILTIHHCTYDGASLKMLLDLLESQYLDQDGTEVTPFRNFIQHLQKTDLQDTIDFWKEQLSSADYQHFPSLPSLTYIPQANDEIHHSILVDWPRTEMTPSTILRSTWAILEAQYVAANSVVFGVTTSGRQASMVGIEHCSGPTIATVPIATSIDWNGTIKKFLGQVQQQSISMIPHEQYGLQNIQRTAQYTGLGLFQTLLVIQPIAEGKSLQDDSFLFKARSFASNLDTRGTDPFNVYPLMMICQLTASGVKLHISFDDHVLNRRQINCIVQQFETILRQLCTDEPQSIKLGDIQTASDFDIAQFWERNTTLPEEPQMLISDLISAVSSAQPNSLAIDSWDGQLSYKSFEELSTTFARKLNGLRIPKGSTVSLSLEKSKWVPVMQLAILKAGYVCLLQSTAVPEQRVGTVFKNLGVILAVASPSRVGLMKEITNCLTIDQLLKTKTDDAHNNVPSPKITDPAIVLVSSGSTGEPKHILWNNRTVTANTQGAGKVFGISPSSRLFQFASYDFDVATIETLSILAYGGCLCIPSEHDRLSDIAGVINKFEANVLHCTPSTGRLLSPKEVPTLLTLVQAGEKLAKEDVDRWSGNCQVINWYGPAECSLAAVYPANLQSWRTGVIGRLHGGVESSYLPLCWLVDPQNHHRLAPFGAIGEIALEGPTCAIGYIGNPTLTKSAFCDYPKFLSLGQVGGESGRKGQIFRTGDLARYDSSGNLVFVGRKDSQLKIRGQLVAPEEVEYHIRESLDLPDLQVVVDGIIPRDGTHLTLVGFIVKDDLDSITDQLNEKLQKLLPNYAIPSYYIPIPDIPSGPTGKKDRKKLQKIGSSFTPQMSSKSPRRKPITATEIKLQNLWAIALNIEKHKISANDSFLQIGNSIEAMRLVGIARDQGIVLTVAQIFNHPTLSEMASVLQDTTNHMQNHIDPFTLLGKSINIQLARKDAASLCGIGEECIEDIFPCTPLQEGLLSLTTKRNGDYTGRNILRLHPSVDISRFKSAWENAVSRIPILRTRIIDLPSQGLVQVVTKDINFWTEEAGTEDYIRKEQQLPIGLGTSLMQCSLFPTDLSQSGRFSFGLTMHHSIYDGMSTVLVFETLKSLYHNTSPPALSQSQPFVQYINRCDKIAKAEFWGKQFAQLNASQFPTLPFSGYQPQPDSDIDYHFDDLRWRTDDFTPATTIRAAFALLCSYYSDSSDVVFGTVVNGRSAPIEGMDRLAAPTIATLPIRVSIDGGETISSMLVRLQDQATQMIPYEQSGLSSIQKINDEARQACQFQSLLVIQPPEQKIEEDCLFLPQPSSPESERNRYRGFSSYAFSVGCTLLENGIQLRFTFDSMVMDHAMVRTMGHHFEHLLRLLVSHNVDEILIDNLEMATSEDLNRIWDWNSVMPKSITRCMHDIIAETAKSQPTATAISAWDGELTYQELDELSNHLAHQLVDLGVGRGMIIPIYLNKSVFSFLAFLGVIKAGGAGLFLDPALPISRLQIMVQQVKPILILTSPTNEALGCSMVDRAIILSHDSVRTMSERSKQTPPLPSVDPSDLLYAVFTSGSTGTPKGVLIQHRQFCSAIFHQQEIFKLSPTTRMYDFSAPSFDVVYGAVLPTLAAGGTVCIPSDEERKSDLTESIRRFQATHTLLTPSIARLLDPNRIPTLQNIYLGGEAPTNGDLALWAPHATIINCYGPSECSVGTVYWQVPSPIPSKIPIGKGYGVSTWVVDPRSSERLSPLGTVGELYLEGPLVGQGYFRDEEKTAASFIHSPSWLRKGSPNGDIPGREGRMYKTGDLVRYDAVDGSLLFVGRKNTQVKLRGQRIELGEVEYHLRQVLIDMSMDASVIAEVVNPEVTGRPVLIAFIELGPMTVSQISGNVENTLSERVPIYMVPTTLVPINQVPLAPSGKTDRRRLREIGSRLTLEQLSGGCLNRQPPSTKQECLLQKLWASVIGIPANQVYTDSSFLRLGGDSISAMRLASLARSQGIPLTVQQILTRPRLSDMAQGIVALDSNQYDTRQIKVAPFSLLKDQKTKEATLDYISRQCNISLSQIQDVFPCTGVQKSLLSMTAKSENSYIARFALRLTKNIDVARLMKAWEEVIKTRAPILRCRIVETPNEGLVQVEVNESLRWDTSDTLSAYIQQNQRPMGLSTPLARLAIIEDALESGPCCLLTQHHAIYDGYSISLLLKEVSRVYARLADNRPMVPFQVFIKHIMEIDHEKAQEFWRNQFLDSEAVPFPSLPHDDYHPKADSTVRREFVDFHWPKWDVTASTLIRAAWSILTARYTETEDVVFGTMVTGRQTPLPGIDRMIAPLINAVPVRVKMDPKKSVDVLLRDIQKQSMDMIAYEHTELLDIRLINADAERGSRFNTLLIVQPAQQGNDENPVDGPFDDYKIRSINDDLDDYNPNAVMVLCQLTGNNSLDMEISFDSKVVDAPQMERIASQFEHILRQISVTGNQAVEELDFVSPKDLDQVWQWNAMAPPARAKCVHELIGETVKRQPDSPAISSWDGQLSYSELDRLSGILATQLKALGAGPGSIIPLCFEKSMWHPVAALGAMKAGAACVAMDSTQPESRLRSIVQQLHSSLLLTSGANFELASTLSDARVVIVDRHHLDSPVHRSLSPLPKIQPSDTLYVVFTSGSTGTPKGVVTTHQNFASAATHQREILHIQSSSRVFDFVSYNFDVSWSNHLQTFIRGGCLCIPSESERRNDIPGAFNRMNCDYVYFTPSVARSLVPSSMPGLKCLAMGGEPIQQSEVLRWAQAEVIIGIYGPAECAQALSFVRLDANCHNNHVGYPFGANMWLVNPGRPDSLAPIGAIGELLIEGPTVSQGYFADPDKTKGAYIKDPSWLLQGTSTHPGRSGTLYKTGDLLRYNSDGSLDFIGRKDGMIKLRGQRIELAEVEHHVRVCLGGVNLYNGLAAEIIRPQNGNPLLAVFISLADKGTGSEESPSAFNKLMEDLEEKLSYRLPQYMIPGAYIPVEQIPMTTTNKTDRRALRELGNAQTLERLAELQSHGKKRREPSTVMEQRLQMLWSSVLGVEPASIGADSNFLRIGGESIAAMRLVAAARAQNLSISVAQVFKAPRLSELALLATENTEEDGALQLQSPFSLLKTRDHEAFIQTHVEPFLETGIGTVKDIVPCTDFQKCAVLDALQHPPGRLPIWIFGLPHNVDFDRLESACQKLVHHFDILHTVFIHAYGQLWQVFLDNFKPVYDTFDVDHDVESFTHALCEDDLKNPRRLGRSFIRFIAVRDLGGKHRLVFRIAHAQFDGYTWGMMVQTLASLYHQQPQTMQPTFRQLVIFNDQKKKEDYHFWASRLQNYPHPSWSPTSPIDAVYSTTDRMSVSISFPMPNIQHHEGVSAATFFHAACALVFSQTFGQKDVVFGRLVTGRSMLPGCLQRVVGPTMTEIPVIVSIGANDTIVNIAQRLQVQFIDDSAHESAGMEEIIRNCTDWPEQIADFGWRTAFQQADEMDFKFLDAESTISVHEHDLLPRGRPEVYATPRNGELHLEFEGNRRLISEETVQEVLTRIQIVLGRL